MLQYSTTPVQSLGLNNSNPKRIFCFPLLTGTFRTDIVKNKHGEPFTVTDEVVIELQFGKFHCQWPILTTSLLSISCILSLCECGSNLSKTMWQIVKSTLCIFKYYLFNNCNSHFVKFSEHCCILLNLASSLFFS